MNRAHIKKPDFDGIFKNLLRVVYFNWIVWCNLKSTSFRNSAFFCNRLPSWAWLYAGIYDWQVKDNREIGEGVVIDPRAIHYEEYDEKNPPQIRLKNKIATLIGSREFDREDFERASKLITEGKINPLQIVTLTLPFDKDIIQKLKRGDFQ